MQIKRSADESGDTAEGFKTPRADPANGSLLARPADLPPLQTAPGPPLAPQMVDVSTLENMFEKFSTQIGTKLDLHIKAASVAQAATDKKLEEHDKRLTEGKKATDDLLKEMEEIRKTLKTGAAARGASAPPAGARNTGNYDLSAFDSSRAQIDAVKTKLEIVFNAYAFDLANAEPTIKQLMQQAGYVGSGVFSVLDVKPFRQGKGTRVILYMSSRHRSDYFIAAIGVDPGLNGPLKLQYRKNVSVCNDLTYLRHDF